MCKSDKSLYSIRIETKRKNVSSDNLIDIYIWYGHQCSVPSAGGLLGIEGIIRSVLCV